MNKTLSKKYAKLSAQIKALEAEQKLLKLTIMESMEQEGLEKVLTDIGSFTRAHKTSWKYSDAVAKMNEKLKMAQLKEQQKGVAKKSETEYLLFTAKK